LYNEIEFEVFFVDYVFVGRIITTHGLKGEMKIRSQFLYKDQVFVVGSFLYLGKEKEKHEILSYRVHQDYDMVCLDGIVDIDQAIGYKQVLVYALKSQIQLPNDDFLDEDLLGLMAYYEGKKIGVVKRVVDQGNGNFTIQLDNGVYIPKQKHFILAVDFSKQQICFQNLEGLL